MESMPNRVYVRNITATELIAEFLHSLKIHANGENLAVILIGSFARGMATSQSDVDLLLIADTTVAVEHTASALHVQSFSTKEFRSKLQDGDDFALWSIRYGIPVVSSNIWNSLIARPEASRWPDWKRKIGHSLRRLVLGAEMLRIGDTDAAREELLYAASHVGRAILLRENVFPLSRPEMITQLKEVRQDALSGVMNVLVYGDPTVNELRRTALYVKKLLVALDRNQVRQLSLERSRKRAAKRSRLAGPRRLARARQPR